MFTKTLLILSASLSPFLLLVFMGAVNSITVHCPRDRSRAVRKVLQHYMTSVLNAEESPLSTNCVFHPKRDIFHNHEAHKTEEGYGKWACEYCGKMFYAENFLDNHFQNRHAGFLNKGKDSICLADYCDIFRCEIVSGWVNPTFWDSALCIEDDMEELATKCQMIFQACLSPTTMTPHVFDAINKTRTMVCSSLTCSRYWYTGKVEENQWLMLLKTFCTVFLIGSFIVYYFLAYHHFYSESLFYEPPDSGVRQTKPYDPNYRPRKHRPRNRVPIV
ncbi:uncharacterized protein LOC128242494 [Mya arenaria]|uniref:uncharacterized protein LOC128242494 n=1 Tax=Mya arenaria TaxID=6604 RepID=UPI0022DF1633|nr:uncharacterized protein LOC128242494 [Mya arenaria]